MHRTRTLATAVLLLTVTACTSGGGNDGTAAPAPSSAAPSLAPTLEASAAASASAAAAAEQARLVQAYPAALRATVESVYDQVQPMLDAFDAFDRPRPETAQVRDDVFAAGGARLALEARLRELAGRRGPDVVLPTRRAAGRRARGARQGRGRAVQRHAAPLPAPAAPSRSTSRASRPWTPPSPPGPARSTAVYGGKDVPLTPRRDRAGVRAPGSKGGWLLTAGQTCGRAGLARVAAATLPRCRSRRATRRGCGPRSSAAGRRPFRQGPSGPGGCRERPGGVRVERVRGPVRRPRGLTDPATDGPALTVRGVTTEADAGSGPRRTASGSVGHRVQGQASTARRASGDSTPQPMSCSVSAPGEAS